MIDFEKMIAETQESHQQNIPQINLGLMSRKPLKVSQESEAGLFVQAQVSRFSLYEYLADIGYYLPAFRSRAVTYNYLIGVLSKDYYCFKGKFDCYENKLKATNNAIYFEIIKKTRLSLGYDTLNLPEKKYLINILFNLVPEHPFFNSTKTDKPFKVGANGFYEIPVTCRELVYASPFLAQANTYNAVQSGPNAINRVLNTTAKVFSFIEKAKYYCHKVKQAMKEDPALQDTQNFEELNNLLDHIN